MISVIVLMIQIVIAAAVPAAMVYYGIYRKANMPDAGDERAWVAVRRARLSQDAMNYQYFFLAHMMIATGINIAIVAEIFLIASSLLIEGNSWITAFSIAVVQLLCALADILISRRLVKRRYDKDGNLRKLENEEASEDEETDELSGEACEYVFQENSSREAELRKYEIEISASESESMDADVQKNGKAGYRKD